MFTAKQTTPEPAFHPVTLTITTRDELCFLRAAGWIAKEFPETFRNQIESWGNPNGFDSNEQLKKDIPQHGASLIAALNEMRT